ncbi:hypothetical protein ACJZ2D_000242 [Fusarium nematophilum]
MDLKPLPLRPKTRDDFDIAIICALPLEADTVVSLFDHDWEEDEDPNPYGKADGDPAAYSFGAIGRHNVVVAHLPGMGKVSSATIATFCRMSFRKIRLALVVGVCGGAPAYKDQEVFLGDVIISDGVVQYDLGRRYPDGFVLKDTLVDRLGRPDLEVRSLLAKLKLTKKRSRMQEKMGKHLSWLLTAESELDIKYPGRSGDRLFPPDYRHKHQRPSPECKGECLSWERRSDPVCENAPDLSCDDLGCWNKELAPEFRRLGGGEAEDDRPMPAIHIGHYASGDIVLKDGQDRDGWKQKTGAIGFEMESAGAWDIFDCVVVIKGVCDYADSHKSKGWQNYAAASAAACTKEFLRHWISTAHQRQVEAEAKQRCEHLRDSLRFFEMNERANNISAITPKTFRWIFAPPKSEHVSDDFISWLESDQPVYWISGKLASGKSTLMKFIASHTKTKESLSKWQEGARIYSHYFWKPGKPMQHSFKGLLCSLAYQIFSDDESFVRDEIQTKWDATKKGSPHDWDQQDLLKILLTHAKKSSQAVCYFIDAVDEVKVCISSRPEQLFQHELHRYPSLKVHNLTRPDMEEYVHETVRRRTPGRLSDLSISALADKICYRADGAFLWVVMVTNSLIRGIIYGDEEGELYNRLYSMPQNLMGLYRDLLQRSAEDRPIYREKASMAFNLLLFRPRYLSEQLTLFKMSVALLENNVLGRYLDQGHELTSHDCVKYRQNALKVLEVGCAGLLEITGTSRRDLVDSNSSDPDQHFRNARVDFTHRTAQDFLLDTDEGQTIWKTGDLSKGDVFSRFFRATLLDRRILSISVMLPTDDATLSPTIRELVSLMRALGASQDIIPPETLSRLLSLTHKNCGRDLAFGDLEHTRIPCLSGEVFLAWAGQFGFEKYVLENLESIGSHNKRKVLQNILFHCCELDMRFVLREHQLLGKHKLIRHFLNTGIDPKVVIAADPLEKIEGSPTLGLESSWMRFLVCMLGSRCRTWKGLDMDSAGIETFKAFVQAGVNMNEVARIFVQILFLQPCLCSTLSFQRYRKEEAVVFEVNAQTLFNIASKQLQASVRPEPDVGLEKAGEYVRAIGLLPPGSTLLDETHFGDDSNLLWEALRPWLETPRAGMDQEAFFELRTRTHVAFIEAAKKVFPHSTDLNRPTCLVRREVLG